MALQRAEGGPTSLVGVTIRRSAIVGRTFLLIGTGLSALYAAILSSVPGNAFTVVFPLLLPVFATIGGLGAMMVFTNDRVKGVLEYLIAYGVRPRRIFTNVLTASIVLLTVVLCVTTAVGLTAYVARGHGLSLPLLGLLAFYSFPMSYASSSLATTTGMYWTVLSSPRAGMNGPLGLLPLIGIAPPLAALAVLGIASGYALAVLVGMVVAVAALVLVLLSLSDSLLPPERLLSPA